MSDLNLMVDLWLNPLRQNKIVSPEILAKVFSNVEVRLKKATFLEGASLRQ